MKVNLILFLFLTISYSASAKKSYVSLEVMAGKADLIVVGEISKTHLKSYSFAISETIKGEKTDEILVQMFKEWICDTRQAKPEKGQKLVLFLTKELGKYELINGSTGEIFVLNGKVKTRSMDGKPTLVEFVGMLCDFVDSYSLEGNFDDSQNIRFKQLKPNGEIAELRKKSSYTDWLFARIEKYVAK